MPIGVCSNSRPTTTRHGDSHGSEHNRPLLFIPSLQSLGWLCPIKSSCAQSVRRWCSVGRQAGGVRAWCGGDTTAAREAQLSWAPNLPDTRLHGSSLMGSCSEARASLRSSTVVPMHMSALARRDASFGSECGQTLTAIDPPTRDRVACRISSPSALVMKYRCISPRPLVACDSLPLDGRRWMGDGQDWQTGRGRRLCCGVDGTVSLVAAWASYPCSPCSSAGAHFVGLAFSLFVPFLNAATFAAIHHFPFQSQNLGTGADGGSIPLEMRWRWFDARTGREPDRANRNSSRRTASAPLAVSAQAAAVHPPMSGQTYSAMLLSCDDWYFDHLSPAGPFPPKTRQV